MSWDIFNNEVRVCAICGNREIHENEGIGAYCDTCQSIVPIENVDSGYYEDEKSAFDLFKFWE